MEFGIIIQGLKNFIISILVCTGMFVMPGYKNDAKELVDNSSKDTFMQEQTTLVYDNNGELITKIKEGKDSYYISFDTITDYTKEAFIATEDKTFYKHNGVDLVGLGRAFVNLIKNGEISGGGSTITQQLARNIFLTHEQSYERKLKEIYISYLLEKKYSKDELLEFYINSIYFANGSYGIESASRKYFGISSTELSLAQTAFLCAIPNNPTLYNPFTNPENTKKRQARILNYMYEDGYITEDEYNGALLEEIVLASEEIHSNNYVDTFVRDSATKILMELDGFVFRDEFDNSEDKEQYSIKYAEAENRAVKRLNNEGYKIYTSIDSNKQAALQEAVDTILAGETEITSEGIYSLQGSAVSIDNATGRILAIVGGRTQDEVSFTFNRAYQSYRQPGSTIKPLIVYAPAIEKGYYPTSILNDEREENGPQNYNNNYEGAITLRYAVEDSKNTTAWSLFRELTPDYGLSFLKQMGFKKIVADDYNLAAALGGLTYGTNTLEIASAYSTFARDGIYVTPSCINKITDSDGNVVYENTTEGIRVYTEKAARIMTDVLSSVMTTGSGAKYKLSNMPSAGKTGTTNNILDSWFTAYTPMITTSVWVGHDTPKPLEGIHGSVLSGQIWTRYMSKVHEDLESVAFKTYENLAAEEEAIKSAEEQKALVYNLRKDIRVYETCDLSTVELINESYGMYNSIMERLYQVSDEKVRNELNERTQKRREYIES